MRPTPTKAARPTSTTRTPQRRSSPRRGASTAKNNNNAAGVSDNRSNSSTLKNNGDGVNNRTKKAYGRRARMSPRTHGAAIANSLASPAVDSAFLMSTAAPITPSKRSSAESALHRLARQSKQDANNTSQLPTGDDGYSNNNTVSKRKQRKRAKVNYNETSPDAAQRYSEEEEEEQTQSKRKSPRKSLPTQFYHALSSGKQKTEDVNNNKAKPKKTMNIQDSKTNKQAKKSPRKSCPTQFYHNLQTNEGHKSDDTAEQKTDMRQKNEAKTTNQASREGYKCRKCGLPKKGHTCTVVDKPMEEKDGEGAKKNTQVVESEESPLLPVSSNTKDNQTKSKRDGKKRRSRGGRQGVSALLSLETLQTSSANKRDISSSSKKGDSAEANRATEGKVGTSASSKKDVVATKKKGSMVKDVEKTTPRAETMVQIAEDDDRDQPASPFPSSPLQTSNLECPESGSISVGAQLSPKKKNGAVPEAICIRELMMSCLTEEDKEEEKRRSELKSAEQNADQEETIDVDAPLPHTPIHTKETPNEAFSPLSMTSPLRANNLLETSYNEDQPEVQDTSHSHVPPRSHNSKRRSGANQLAQKPSRGSNVLDLEPATQTKDDDSDEAKQLEMIQAEKQAVKRYQEKMAEFGKLELEARLVTERMRQIEERMKQIETSSITNDLREYDELKRRTSYPYPSEKVRPTKRKIMSSQRHYGYSEDEYYSDEYDSHRNWRHSTHGRHGDRERHIKRQKVRSDSRRSRSPSGTQTKSNSRRRLMEDSKKEYEGPTTQTQRSHKKRRPNEDSTTDRHERLSKKRGRKKGSKKRSDSGEEGRLSTSQMNKTLKSPYAELQADNDETKLRPASQEDVQPDEKDDALDVEEETGTTTATSVESAKMPDSANVDKKEADSSSTKQSVPERADADHPGKTTQPNDKTNRPLYWLAGGESDSDEDSWDFDGPMILPPPPA